MKKSIRPIYWLVIVAMGSLAGCAGGPTEEEIALQQAQEQLTVVRQAYADLQQLRVDLEAAEIAVAEIEAIDEKTRTEEQTAQLAELGAEIEAKRALAEETYDSPAGTPRRFLDRRTQRFPDLAGRPTRP